MMPTPGRPSRRRALRRIFGTLAWTSLAFPAGLAAADLPVIKLSVGKHYLTVEVAHNESARARGLMYRRILPEHRGMLFVFPDTARHGMWMMNTYVPLSVAFLDGDGTIINIEEMVPQTRTNHVAARPAKYALEANRGWFAKRGITPGMKIEGLGEAPFAR